LFIGRLTQRFHLLDRIFFLQDATDQVICLGAAWNIFSAGEIQTQNIFADFLVEACTRFLTQSTSSHQFRQNFWCFVDGEERIILQVVLHCFDHVRHGVETDYVRSTESTRRSTA